MPRLGLHAQKRAPAWRSRKRPLETCVRKPPGPQHLASLTLELCETNGSRTSGCVDSQAPPHRA